MGFSNIPKLRKSLGTLEKKIQTLEKNGAPEEQIRKFKGKRDLLANILNHIDGPLVNGGENFLKRGGGWLIPG